MAKKGRKPWPDEQKLKRLTIYIHPADRERLVQRARKEGTTVSVLVREWVLANLDSPT